MVKKSPTAETKKLIYQLLSSQPKRVFTLGEIKQWCLENEPEGFTDGVLSGAMRSLSRAENSNIHSQERGKYFFDADYTTIIAELDEISPVIVNILEEALEQIRQTMNNIDILTLTAEDIVKIQNFKAAIDKVSQIKESLEESE